MSNVEGFIQGFTLLVQKKVKIRCFYFILKEKKKYFLLYLNRKILYTYLHIGNGLILRIEIRMKIECSIQYPDRLCNELFPNRTELFRTEPNQTEPNRTEPNRTEPNRTEPKFFRTKKSLFSPKIIGVESIVTTSKPLIRACLVELRKSSDRES